MFPTLSLCHLVTTGSTMPPGIAQPPPSFLSMHTNSRIFSPDSEFTAMFPTLSLCHLVTTGSAAWFGPHRPKIPRPWRPVRPRIFSGLPTVSCLYSPSWLCLLTFPSIVFHLGLNSGLLNCRSAHGAVNTNGAVYSVGL